MSGFGNVTSSKGETVVVVATTLDKVTYRNAAPFNTLPTVTVDRSEFNSLASAIKTETW